MIQWPEMALYQTHKAEWRRLVEELLDIMMALCHWPGLRGENDLSCTRHMKADERVETKGDMALYAKTRSKEYLKWFGALKQLW